MRVRHIGLFKHFKNGHTYVIENVGKSEKTGEYWVSYYDIEETDTIHFSPLSRMVEDVDRPDEGFPLRPRFEPMTPTAIDWRSFWREKLGVTVEKK